VSLCDVSCFAPGAGRAGLHASGGWRYMRNESEIARSATATSMSLCCRKKRSPENDGSRGVGGEKLNLRSHNYGTSDAPQAQSQTQSPSSFAVLARVAHRTKRLSRSDRAYHQDVVTTQARAAAIHTIHDTGAPTLHHSLACKCQPCS
jgi:hypothetical protein